MGVKLISLIIGISIFLLILAAVFPIEDILSDGKWISIIWLGVDYYLGFNPNHKPLIFETMVFSKHGSLMS